MNVKKPFVFISYAHKDDVVVLPAIEQMQSKGVSLWYDNGITAGSEWPEFVAEKVVDCDRFVLFISKAYLESQNCKRELNFAISRQKEILSVFLEDVTLSPGMEMQLGSYQAIFRNRFSNDQLFYSTLAAETFLDPCRNMGQEVAEPVPPHEPVVRQTPMVKTWILRKNTAALLALLLGTLGIHHFYMKRIWLGAIYIVLCGTGIPTIISVLEAILIYFLPIEKVERIYHRKIQP